MFYCIDFESTGAANGQQPKEIAWVEIDLEGEIGNWKEIGFTGVKGGRDLGGIEETVPELRDAWPQIKDSLHGKVLAGHNINYDHSLLLKSFPAFQNSGLIDTLTIYRQLYGEQIADYSLDSLLGIFQISGQLEKLKLNDHFEPHRALFDAYGCALLLQRLLQDPATAVIFKDSGHADLL